jgi:hypothetical protein
VTTGRWQRPGRAGGAARGSSCPLRTPGTTAAAVSASQPPLEVAALPLIHPSPDPELVGFCRVLKARSADWASLADLPGLRGGGAVQGEEDIRVFARTQAVALPVAEGCGGRHGRGDG